MQPEAPAPLQPAICGFLDAVVPKPHRAVRDGRVGGGASLHDQQPVLEGRCQPILHLMGGKPTGGL
jgi:hypothetical protein